MRYFFSAVATIAWGLWFGGVIGLFVFLLGVLFKTFGAERSELFGETATVTFVLFEKCQLILGAIALVAAFGWRVSAPGASRTVLFCLLAVAAVASITSSRAITPQIVQIRQQQMARKLTGEAPDVPAVQKFQKLHALSMWVYLTQTLALLAAGAVLPVAARSDGARRMGVTSHEPSAA